MIRPASLFLCLATLTAFSLAPARQADAAPETAPLPVSSPVLIAKAAPRRDLPASRLKNRRALLSRHAMQFKGKRYRFGAASPNVTDCSGMTMQLYRKVGIKLPHSARAQYKRGKPVSKSKLLPGDLVFFNTRGGISHVGMYIGNGKMIHAANPRRGVRIDTIMSGYYAKKYVGARRLLPEGAPAPAAPKDAEEGHGEPPVYEDAADNEAKAPVSAPPGYGTARALSDD